MPPPSPRSVPPRGAFKTHASPSPLLIHHCTFLLILLQDSLTAEIELGQVASAARRLTSVTGTMAADGAISIGRMLVRAGIACGVCAFELQHRDQDG